MRRTRQRQGLSVKPDPVANENQQYLKSNKHRVWVCVGEDDLHSTSITVQSSNQPGGEASTAEAMPQAQHTSVIFLIIVHLASFGRRGIHKESPTEPLRLLGLRPLGS